jgi:N-methylhydantoinase A
MADYREDDSQTKVAHLTLESTEELRRDLQVLARGARGTVMGYGLDAEALRVDYRADLRFLGQEHTVTIDVPDEWVVEMPVESLHTSIRERFTQTHRQLYGHGDETAEMEVVTRRCRVLGRTRHARLPAATHGAPAAPTEVRDVFFRNAAAYVPTNIYQRAEMAGSQMIEGPAIIEEWTSTTVVPPGFEARVDSMGNLRLANVAALRERRRAAVGTMATT